MKTISSERRALLAASDGRARLPIILPAAADRVTRFAARELSRYLQAISGATFRVIGARPDAPPPTGPAIRLETLGESTTNSPRIDRENPPPTPPEEGSPVRPFPSWEGPGVGSGRGSWVGDDPTDGFRLETTGPQLLVRGQSCRGTLYGVYALLERLGCRFLEPGLERVPRATTLVIPRLRVSEAAAFPLRNVFRNIMVAGQKEKFTFLDPKLALPQIDWMAKRRLNHYEFYIDYYRYDLWEKHKHLVLEALLDRGFDLEVTHHSIHYFCPPDENHDFGEYGPATYQRNHPDWFLPSYECGPRGRWQTRVELPAVQKIIVQRYLEYCARNPELKVVGLWPDDVPMNAPSRSLNPADGYLQVFWNRVAAALHRERPGNRLGIIAYFELIKPPRRVRPHPSEHCWFCPIERDMRYAVDDQRNRRFLPWLKGWTNKMAPGQVGIFEYYGWSNSFIPFRQMMRRDLGIYRELKVGGLYAWSGFGYNALGLDYRWALDFLTLTQLLWNPDAATDALQEAWAAAVFGRAGTRVLDFHDYLARQFQREATRGLAPGYEWLNLDVLHGAQAILASARKLADSESAARRINLLEKQAAWQCADRTVRRPPPPPAWYGV